MAASSPFAEHCLDLLAPLGPVTLRRMFGGWGFWLRGDFMALISDERLYLKADDLTRETFLQAGCEPFVYRGRRGDEVSMSYYSAPDGALEDPEGLRPWATLAAEAALRSRQRKRPRPKGGAPGSGRTTRSRGARSPTPRARRRRRR